MLGREKPTNQANTVEVVGFGKFLVIFGSGKKLILPPVLTRIAKAGP